MDPVTPDPEILPFKEYVAMRGYDYIAILCASINMTSITSFCGVYPPLYIVFIVITNS